jgi:hypothetical protein
MVDFEADLIYIFQILFKITKFTQSNLNKRYAGDADLKLEAQGLLAGLRELQVKLQQRQRIKQNFILENHFFISNKFQGDFRIILKPLCDCVPFFSSMTIFLLKSPVKLIFFLKCEKSKNSKQIFNSLKAH